MDMRCRRCGEPWDWWYIRDEVLMQGDVDLYPTAKDTGVRFCVGFDFEPGPYIVRCPACKPGNEQDQGIQEVMSAVADILGDDIDGFMAEMEDLEGLI